MTIVRAEARLVGRDSTAEMFRGFLRNAETANKQFAQKFRATFQLVTGGLIGQQLGLAIRESIQKAGDIEALAQAFSTTTAEISRLDYAARQSNSSIEEVAGSFQRLFTGLSRAEQGSKRQAKALEDLGLSARQLIGMDLSDQIGLIGDAWNRLDNPQQKARIAQDLFGASTAKIVPLLKRGSDGIRELGLESDRLGNTLTKETAAKLAEAEASMHKVEAASGALKRELAIGLGPALVGINEFFTTAAKGARNFWEELLGPTEPVAMLSARLAELADRRNTLIRSIEQAQAHGASPKLIEGWRTEISGLETEMNRVNEALQQFGRDAEAYAEGAIGATAATRELAEVMVTAKEIAPGYSEALQKMFRETMTDAQKATDAYAEFIAKLEILRDAGVIDQAELSKRREDFLDRTLKEVEVTAKKIFPEANKGAKDLMATLRDEGARRAVGYISDAIMGLDDGARNFAKGMIDAFRRILADKAAQQLMAWFEGLGGGGGSGGGGFFGALASGLGALFGGGSTGSTVSAGGGSGPGNFFRGFAASGMTLSPGEWAIAGERGKPEAVFGGQSGATIIPLPKGGRDGGNVTVDARTTVHIHGNADREQMVQLQAVLAEHRRLSVNEAEARIVTGLQRNRYDLRQV